MEQVLSGQGILDSVSFREGSETLVSRRKSVQWHDQITRCGGCGNWIVMGKHCVVCEAISQMG